MLVVALAMTPILAWLWPRDFWAPAAIVGLFALPAARLREQDRPAAIVLFAALIWAAVSTLWSPYHPAKPGETTILKMAFELPLYGAAVLAARRADPVLARRALQIVAWGCAIYGLILLAEALTQGALYKGLRGVWGPMRDDIAEARIGHSTYVLGALWPIAAVGASKAARPWLALAMAAGVGAAALAFGDDAPVLALVVAPLAALIVWRWPSGGPRLLAGVAATLFLTMPAIVWAVRHFGDYAAIEARVPQTDAMRLGYWSHAIDWIRLRPLQGWGLDASRSFGPGIRLHPHNQPLQVWMELGAVGAVLAAAFWGVTLMGLARPKTSLIAMAAAASAAVYLLFGVNFGVWQEWWLGLGALIAVLTVLNFSSAHPGESRDPS
ncbi:O-antigen ligase family protein [Phenylobacterium sp.]|uniref:O-antigen ligase family protein n=1 Tax=Phenylobacterium sp. TaxID=1871053 RepID=UPI002F42BDC3